VDGELPLAGLLPLVALGIGADVIEKHLTLFRALRREDYESALNPDEFAAMVSRVREAALTLGPGGYSMSAADLAYRKTMKKHVVARRDLPAGTRLGEEDIIFRRTNSDAPLFTVEELVGRVLSRPVGKNEVIVEAVLEPAEASARRVVAALLCRVQSTRLYGKPLQLIGPKTILEHLIDQLRTVPEIQDVILAISEGEANRPFIELAAKIGVDWVVGDQEDGLARIILAAEKVAADVIVRFTTECPFIYVENLGEMIRRHTEEDADLTVCENLPDGAYGEIISLGALRRSHQEGEDRHRTAWVSLYIFENPGKFKILRLLPREPLRRPDLRITVDYPEDLVVCRKIYQALGGEGKRIPVESIIEFLDANPEIKAMNAWIKAGAGRIWS
jgi:spore coat polysaccharide biosynthesis protein SpsF